MTNGSAYKLAKFAVVMMCPHRPDLWLREKPVRRHHFKLALRNELVDPEIKEQLAELGRRHAMANAGNWVFVSTTVGAA